MRDHFSGKELRHASCPQCCGGHLLFEPEMFVEMPGDEYQVVGEYTRVLCETCGFDGGVAEFISFLV